MLLKILILSFISSFAIAQNQRIDSFTSAKKILKKFEIFNEETLYCGCEINKNNVSTKKCGYNPPSASKRALKVEWEHVVPASALSEGIFYNKNLCGKKSKRSCLEDLSPEYSKRVSDLYNLYAEDGLINLIRSDKPMEELTESEKDFGRCDIKTNSRSFTPRKEVKGIVARVYLYMNDSYGGKIISNKNKKLYEAWSKMYPVTESECKRANFIEKIQGNPNKFVKFECEKKGFSL